MAPRHPPSLALLGATLALVACATPDPTPADLADIQLAAATAIAESIASNPGTLEAICVRYAGDQNPPPLPSIDAPAPALAGEDGCVERDGRLVSVDGGGQAISMSVGAPEPTRGSSAEVSVFTSTGLDDLAAYLCTIRMEEGAWRSLGCELGAVS